MYKKASENLQSRVERKPDRAVVDISTFRNPFDVKERLGQRKVDLQMELTNINHLIKEAAARGRLGNYTRAEAWNSMQRKRVELVNELQKLEMEIRKIKPEIRKRDLRDNKSFSEKFVSMAKIMLADEVFMRLIAATTHALAEDDEAQQ